MSHLTILSFGRVDHPPAFMIFRSYCEGSISLFQLGDRKHLW